MKTGNEFATQVIARIWEFLDGMRAGRFIVDPSERLEDLSLL